MTLRPSPGENPDAWYCVHYLFSKSLNRSCLVYDAQVCKQYFSAFKTAKGRSICFSRNLKLKEPSYQLTKIVN